MIGMVFLYQEKSLNLTQNHCYFIYHLFIVFLLTIKCLIMKIIRRKLHSIAENESFFNEKTLKRDNVILLFSILIFLFVLPLLKGFELKWELDITISVFIISGLTSLRFRKEKFLRLAYLGLITLCLIWINHFIFTFETRIISFVMIIIFLVYITYSMISYVAKNKKVTEILILNAINSYLLMGIIAGFLFVLSEIVYEFLYDVANNSVIFGYTDNPVLHDYIYFSFITLTTVGYGDATPAIPLTKSIAMFISLSGQLYLTILVAMLVGKFISNNDQKFEE